MVPEDSSIVLGGQGQLLNGVSYQGLQLRQEELEERKKLRCKKGRCRGKTIL